MGDLALVLVEVVAGIVALAIHRQAQRGLLPTQVGDLERTDRRAGAGGDAVVAIEDVLDVAEGMVLVRVIVQRIRAAVRRLHAEVARKRISRDEVVHVARAARVVDAGLDGAVAAAVDRDGPAGLDRVGLRLDVDDAGRAQAVLRRQGAGDQRHRLDQARIQRLAEDADALGKDDAVEAVLQAGMLAADMELAEGILHHLGRLQQHLVQRHVVAARHGVDGLRVERVDRCASLRLDAGPCVIEAPDPRGDLDALGAIGALGAGGRGRGIGRACASRLRERVSGREGGEGCDSHRHAAECGLGHGENFLLRAEWRCKTSPTRRRTVSWARGLQKTTGGSRARVAGTSGIGRTSGMALVQSNCRASSGGTKNAAAMTPTAPAKARHTLQTELPG
ncbi:MAG: hypothetical protein JF586_22435 [Burkholderiales bacterium]|nr:hypothetical protein [Burkholderiales bacterium]